jgi:hypothetical protein
MESHDQGKQKKEHHDMDMDGDFGFRPCFYIGL